ncbi:MAG: c-type cytochrome [Pedosphaera sp.]|nr:c-type cytochrome [Pedosphaera sp.]
MLRVHRARPIMNISGIRRTGWIFVSGAGVLLMHTMFVATAAQQLPSGTLLHDFDRDGVEERLTTQPGTNRIEHWDAATKAWLDAGYRLPEGVEMLDRLGRDAGLRFVDLNGDGFDDILFSNPERFAIHLWTKDVKPQLGWTRGWSQQVRSGKRTGAAAEPPSVVGAEVTAAAGQLVIHRDVGVASDSVTTRLLLKALIAFEMPPPKTPQEGLACFQVRPGFRVERVAAEPVVVDPIAFEWGGDGRLWVVEMRDYPLGLDEKGQPGGIVKVLDDTDGDGLYDRATPFLEGLPFPSSVMPWRNGALIAAAPDLIYAEDTDGDGRADLRKVLFTGFKPGNQQHRFNGFAWGLDGWIYAANGDSSGSVKSLRTGKELSISGRDFRFRPDTGEMETVSVQTQFGRRRDDWGNWFGNNNPTWLWHVTVPEHYLRRNPQLAVRSVSHVLANYDDSTRVYPTSASMIRPNQPWSLNHVTSGCSPCPNRDDLFGPEFETSVFISEPVHNVVHREILARDGAGFSSHRAAGEERSEFLSSTDNWFRPTTLKNGPDGALYIADMYRFVIEHPEWISPETQARTDLRAGADRGRLYRVVPTDRARRPIPNLAAMGAEALVAALNSPSGWQRDTAQRLLFERGERGVAGSLLELLGVTHSPQVRLQALATLGLLGALTSERVAAALADPHSAVRCEALRQSELFAGKDDATFRKVAIAAVDGDPSVRMQAAFTLGAWPAALCEPVLRELAARDDTDDLTRVAILSSLRPESALFAQLKKNEIIPKSTRSGASLKSSSADRAQVIASYAAVETLSGDPARGHRLFQTLCLSCHRLRGEGQEVGPDLGMVGIKPVDWLLTAILDPSQAVEPRYRAWTLRLKEGSEIVGLVSGETANNFVLRLAGGVELAVLRSEIATIDSLELSMMPTGFESALKTQDMADLLQWLRSP